MIPAFSALEIAPNLTLGDVVGAKTFPIPEFVLSRDGVSIGVNYLGLMTEDGRVFKSVIRAEDLNLHPSHLLQGWVRYPYIFSDVRSPEVRIDAEHVADLQRETTTALRILTEDLIRALLGDGKELTHLVNAALMGMNPKDQPTDEEAALLNEIMAIHNGASRASEAEKLRLGVREKYMDQTVASHLAHRLAQVVGVSEQDLREKYPHRVQYLARVMLPLVRKSFRC